jgi:hypothetical protein
MFETPDDAVRSTRDAATARLPVAPARLRRGATATAKLERIATLKRIVPESAG